MKTIRVVVARPGCEPVVASIGNNLDAMQGVVGGYIELVPVNGLDLWVNEEGLLIGLPFNRMIGGTPMVGTILVASSNEEGDTIGLTDAQVASAMALLSAPKSRVSA